jgi:hypothetical protein
MPGVAKKNHGKPQSAWSVIQPISELDTSNIKVKHGTTYAVFFGKKGFHCTLTSTK